MISVTLIRHVQSLFNADKTNEEKNCGITDKGVAQALLLTQSFDLLLVSPLKRTIQTEDHSCITYKSMLIHDLFREHKVDQCDFFEDEPFIQETEEEILNRVELAKQYLMGLPSDSNVGIITHGDFVWYFTSKVIDGERFGKWLENGEAITVTIY